MQEELQAIDTGAVDELGRIKQEQDVLQGRMEMMTAKRGAVSEEVFARVKADYEARYAELEQEAEPLKVQAREQFEALQALVEKLSAAHREAQLAREELEFRHSLDEFDEDVFSERAAEVDERLAEREAEVAEADAIVQRFVAVFHTEEELRGAEVPAAAAGDRTDGDVGEEGSAEPDDEPPTSGVEETAATTSTEPEGTGQTAGIVAGDDATEAASPEGAPATPPPAPVNSSYDTSTLEVARLVGLDEDGRVAVEYNLQLGTTTIGRAPKNDIRIRDASVSREHAKIVFTDRGFAIYDLGSENGVWVNGERTKHTVLSEDDVVEFGPGVSPLVFRGP